mmetsp:Transcript_15967/g.39540  ORF Transcript_15967/g.39540 Transcript_15967/m.39540 type:complete len:241 (+) Transcript_15967:943-1665(+)|eukprot:CAMPEP_0113465800 /NCGR_PEP_ID=MMETSP0014_2-20120614/13935_1 /TAXON_ID=2857 /ORGANISM="Nitzschia sp." /LENGTH=240 /DNA_ID=CAMNT_0000357987 /DNA_START=715 /DNA_END=1437 /DNA_ORIENTATION=- /assembly_acc=CAM_ASM_000159
MTAAVYGTRLFGGTDEVKGIFHVSTKFFHIDYLPLFPLSSYIVLHSQPRRAIEVPLQGRSVVLGYVRGLATATSFGMFIWLVCALSNDTSTDKLAATLSFWGIVCLACFLMWHPWMRRASSTRANELVDLITSRSDSPRAVVFRATLQAAVDLEYMTTMAQPQDMVPIVDGIAVPETDVHCGSDDAATVPEKDGGDSENTDSTFDSEGIVASDDIEMGEVVPVNIDSDNDSDNIVEFTMA